MTRYPSSGNCLWTVLAIAFAVTIGLAACSSGGSGGGSGSVGGNAVDPYATFLDLGEEKVLLEDAIVDTWGATLAVDKPGDPLDGLEIIIPYGSYPQSTSFNITYRPIYGHSGNQYFDPVTPLITIENGGQYADEVLTVKIPVTIEDGYHYMAFYYDEETGTLEGIPELEHDATSITIATRHFSDIVVNRVIWDLFIFGTTVASDFQVKRDNWQIENIRTYLSPDGMCSGMSVALLYYYHEKKKKENYPVLYGFYDEGLATTSLDDDDAIKLCATAQWETEYNNDFLRWYHLNRKRGDTKVYFMFIHALLLTGAPQYVNIWPPGGDFGHAMVVYKKSGTSLYVADPNLPEDEDVKIEFEFGAGSDPNELGQFKPFESQWNTGSAKVNFSDPDYIGTSALIRWSYLEDAWKQLDNGNVQWNRAEFPGIELDYPEYSLKVLKGDGSEVPLTDGYKATSSPIRIKVDATGFTARINAWEYLGTNDSDTIEIDLKPGSNNVGLHIEAQLHSDLENRDVWVWTDFKWFHIEYEPDATPTDVAFRDHSDRWFVTLNFPEGQGDDYLFVSEDQLPHDVYGWGELVQINLPDYPPDPALWPEPSVPVKISFTGPSIKDWYLFPASNYWDPASRNTSTYWKNESGVMELRGDRYYWLYIYPESGPYTMEIIQLEGTAY